MSELADIEKAVEELPPDELSKFRDWFIHFDGDQWDQQFESDVAAGRLDAIAQQAIDDLQHGKCTDL